VYLFIYDVLCYKEFEYSLKLRIFGNANKTLRLWVRSVLMNTAKQNTSHNSIIPMYFIIN
jgi:hypothetical protein